MFCSQSDVGQIRPKVSQNHENPSIWDTSLAQSQQKCPKFTKISAFGTLFLLKASESVPKLRKSQHLGHFS